MEWWSDGIVEYWSGAQPSPQPSSQPLSNPLSIAPRTFHHAHSGAKGPSKSSPKDSTKLRHHSITPPLHHSTTPSLHHSITPPLHHSTTPFPVSPVSHCFASLSHVSTKHGICEKASRAGRAARLGSH